MKTLIAIALVIVVALGIYALSSNKDSATQETTETTDRAQTENSDLQGTGGLKNILSLGKDLSCTFERSDDNGGFSGTAYVSGNKLRGDFTMHLEGTGDIDSHLIKADDTTYVWMGNTGSKFSDTAIDADTKPQTDTNSVNLDDEVKYSCSPWRKDTSKFEIPEDVTFTDLSALMENLPDTAIDSTTPSTTPVPKVDCSMCDQVPAGSAQDQCKAALGC